jgi:hypothetical protein
MIYRCENPEKGFVKKGGKKMISDSARNEMLLR